MAQLDAPSDWRPGGAGFNPRRGRQHSFVDIDHEIFSTVILSLPLKPQHKQKNQEAGKPRGCPSPACPGSIALNQQGSPGSPKSPRSNHTKKKNAELTTHSKTDLKRPSAPGLNIAQIKRGRAKRVGHQDCTGSVALKQRGSSQSPKIAPN